MQVKRHSILSTPAYHQISVVLEKSCVLGRGYLLVQFHIVSKKQMAAVNSTHNIVDVQFEELVAKLRSLWNTRSSEFIRQDAAVPNHEFAISKRAAVGESAIKPTGLQFTG